MSTPPEIRLELEAITPERALDLITGNTDNRNIRQAVVESYTRDMLNGRWKAGQGEPIHYDPKTETLGNGQHRLLAIIESETTQLLPMLYAPLSWRMTADQGIKRTFGDVLKIQYHETNPHPMAAAVRYVWEYRRGGEMGGTQGMVITPGTDDTKPEYRGKPTIAELEEVYHSEKGLHDHLIWIGRLHTAGVPIFPSLFTAVHYILYEIDPEDADEFGELICSGVNLPEGSPILALRRVMQGENRPHRAKIQAALIIKAWNAWRHNEQIKTLMYRPGGKAQEAFPQIDGAETVVKRVRRPVRRRKAA